MQRRDSVSKPRNQETSNRHSLQPSKNSYSPHPLSTAVHNRHSRVRRALLGKKVRRYRYVTPSLPKQVWYPWQSMQMHCHVPCGWKA